jgi:O-acetyl-ADP-ribose deacetylase (regulator of RNase III)
LVNEASFNGRSIELVLGDISRQTVDAIVNAANSRLAGGGGVDGAIHRAGGPTIMAETRRLYPQGCPTGSAVISAAGNLPAKYLIHAVGPFWSGGRGEDTFLTSAYLKALELADAYNCRSVALPALSTGAYRYPLGEAASVALRTTSAFLLGLGHASTLALVRFVLFSDPALAAFQGALNDVRPSAPTDFPT